MNPTETSDAPGPRGHWLWGNAKAHWEDPIGFLTTTLQEYGDGVRLVFGKRPLWIFNHPEAAAHVLKRNVENYPKIPGVRPLLGEGLLTAEGEHWKRLKTNVTPQFSPTAVADLDKIIVDCAEQVVTRFVDGDIFPLVRDFALKVVCRALYGIDQPEILNELDNHLQWIVEQGRWRNHYLLAPYYRSGFKRLQYEAKVQKISAIVDYLCARSDLRSTIGQFRADPRWSPRQVRDHASTLILTGYETTANVLAFGVAQIASDQTIQTKLRLAYRTDDGDYVEAFIDELLRCYPPGWILVRQARAQDCVRGFTVGAGEWVGISPYLLQRDLRYWSDGNRFDPERFRDRDWRPAPFTYLPFGAGPRQCVGSHLARAELRTFFAVLLKQRSISADSPRICDVNPLLVLRPKYPIAIRVVPAPETHLQ